MANRLGIFLAGIIFIFGIMIVHPWFRDQSYTQNGQLSLVVLTIVFAAAVYALIRAIAWVFSGR